MKKIINVTAAFLVLVSAVPAYAQQGQDEAARELTIEELYLQNAEIRIIREQAVTQNREMKLSALENIQEMLDEGTLSNNTTEAYFILDYLAGEGLTRRIRENDRLINYFPEVRRRAVNLLGQLGGEQARQSLIGVLLTDIEPMVLSEAAYALGRMGDNQDNAVSQILASTLLSQNAVEPDNNYAYATLLAFEKLAEANGGLNDPLAFEAIIAIAQGNYIKRVRDKAMDILDKLRDY